LLPSLVSRRPFFMDCVHTAQLHMLSSREWPTTTHLASKPSMPVSAAPSTLEVCNQPILDIIFQRLTYACTETLVTYMWKVDETANEETIHFITKIKERDAVVIKDGTATISKAKAAAKL
jgi:hypothetical protein